MASNVFDRATNIAGSKQILDSLKKGAGLR